MYTVESTQGSQTGCSQASLWIWALNFLLKSDRKLQLGGTLFKELNSA